MNKSQFLTVILTLSPEEINEYILEKGKEPKLVRGIIYEE